jgi:hypothetical protein
VNLAAPGSLEQLHAVVAWAATAALVAAAWVCARGKAPRRWALGAGAAAIGLAVVAAGLGVALHVTYRAKLRQRLFIDSPALGWLFERKLHVAFAALLLGVSALATSALLAWGAPDAPGARELRRSAALAWGASAALALAASIASAIVARHAHF